MLVIPAKLREPRERRRDQQIDPAPPTTKCQHTIAIPFDLDEVSQLFDDRGKSTVSFFTYISQSSHI
jgi:hypothetical protein